jgi:hypothetical protein
MADRDRRFVDGVIDVYFDPHQADLYHRQVKQKKELRGCVYPLWENLKGRGRGGEFALTVARHFFVNQGYEVFVSDSSRENPACFILASYPGLRQERPFHPAYKRMVDVFGEEKLKAFNEHAAKEKPRHKKTRNRGGGDPDLFCTVQGKTWSLLFRRSETQGPLAGEPEGGFPSHRQDAELQGLPDTHPTS